MPLATSGGTAPEAKWDVYDDEFDIRGYDDSLDSGVKIGR